jgi:hypothetical protein
MLRVGIQQRVIEASAWLRLLTKTVGDSDVCALPSYGSVLLFNLPTKVPALLPAALHLKVIFCP